MLHQYYPSHTHLYMYELNKDFEFSAAHYIPDESAGKCQNTHGHTYWINLTIVGNELDEAGFLVNFSGLKKYIHDRYDHTTLNDHNEFKNGNWPSTERLAEHIYRMTKDYLYVETGGKVHCVQVIVRETPSSYVIFKQPG